MNILVVDDEKEIADVIALYLQNDEYQVHKFYTGEEALNCIETTKIDLALLDVMLHGFYRPNRGLYHSKVWQTFRWFGQQFILFPTDTIKAAPHSFSNEGDAFSRFSGLLVLSRSIMICDRGCRNPPHHRA